MNRQDKINLIKSYYIEDRYNQIDKDYLKFEEDLTTEKDIDIIFRLKLKEKKINNKYNSILLYITGISDEFDFKKARSETYGGAPPDIDIDFDPLKRDLVIENYIKTYGKDKVAYIGTYGTFGLKSLNDDLARISEPLEPKKNTYENNDDYLQDVLKFKTEKKKIWDQQEAINKIIPPPKFGLAPVFEDLKKTADKTLKDYPEYLELAEYATGMRKQLGVHAAGIVVSDEPLINFLPLFKTSDDSYHAITQWNKDELEELGFLKNDELVVDALSVIDRTIELIYQTTNIKLDLEKDIYEKDGDPKAYQIINKGLLAGLWQMETSGKARELIEKIKPESIDHLSAITSLNRPGPLESGLDYQYINNRHSGTKDPNTPEIVSDLLSDTYGVLVYQEQVMKLCSELAGYNLKEADTIRKIMGKKDIEKLAKAKIIFLNKIKELNKISEEYAIVLWDQMEKFGYYAFNLSHAAAYSAITYATGYLKGNYPLQFYTALMSIKSYGLAPEKWQEKINEYLEELKYFNIELMSPDINKSEIDFTCDLKTNKIIAGFGPIKTISASTIKEIINSRNKSNFKNIYDFFERVNLSKLNTAKFTALVKAGCFDRLGYKRKDLIDNTDNLYNYYREIENYYAKLEDIRQREIKRNEILEQRKQGIISTEKLPIILKTPEIPTKPVINQYDKIKISYLEIKEQAEYIGFYIGYHLSNHVIGEDFTKIKNLYAGESTWIRFSVIKWKEIVTKKGDPMAFVTIEDATSKCEGTIFPTTYKKLNKDLLNSNLINRIGRAFVRVESENPIKVIISQIDIMEE